MKEPEVPTGKAQGLSDRRSAVWGIILFVIAIVLFLTLESIQVEARLSLGFLAIPTILLLLVGWGLAFAAVARRGRSAASTTTVGLLVLFSLAVFYMFMEHTAHVVSGIGFGLPHAPGVEAPGESGIPHVILGFILLVVTMVLTSVAAMRQVTTSAAATRAKKPIDSTLS